MQPRAPTEASYRTAFPQLSDTLLLTGGGLETIFIFHNGIDRPISPPAHAKPSKSIAKGFDQTIETLFPFS